jgi:hypothetical protein
MSACNREVHSQCAGHRISWIRFESGHHASCNHTSYCKCRGTTTAHPHQWNLVCNNTLRTTRSARHKTRGTFHVRTVTTNTCSLVLGQGYNTQGCAGKMSCLECSLATRIKHLQKSGRSLASGAKYKSDPMAAVALTATCQAVLLTVAFPLMIPHTVSDSLSCSIGTLFSLL